MRKVESERISNETLVEVDSNSEGGTLSEIEVAFPRQSPARMLRPGLVMKRAGFEYIDRLAI